MVRFFRENGLHNSLFVDDFLFMISQLLLQKQKQFALETLEKLGWQINYEKSKLIESTKCQFIGFNVFSEGPNGPWIKVLPKKLHKLKCHIQVALSLRWVTAQFLAKIGGECIAMMRAVLPAKLLLQNLYHMLSYRSSWDSVLEVSEACIKDLMWWRDALTLWNGAPLCKRAVEIQVETNALKTGWGGMTLSLEASGTWTKEVSFQLSNYHELLAVLKTLQSFKTVLQGKVVQVLSDNITTVCYINSLGGPNPLMTWLMKVIFTHVHENQMVLSAKFLARSHNCHADRLSRQLSPVQMENASPIVQMVG